MRHGFILVEGQTEEAFVNRVLRPSLSELYLQPIIVKTSRAGQKAYKGGTVRYHEFRKQIARLLEDPLASVITTMIDYQGLGHDFPGRDEARSLPPENRAAHVQSSMWSDLNHSRYLPFVCLHEFEAFLISSPEEVARALQIPEIADRLHGILKRYGGNPEAINDSPAGSPSGRIETLCEELGGSAKRYQKRVNGEIIAERIGLPTIRSHCSHFDTWVRVLEDIASRP